MIHGSIRLARAEDSAALASLCTELGYPADGQDIGPRLQDILADQGHLLLVATDAHDCPIGWIHGLIRRQLTGDPFIQVVGMVVTESERSKSTGTTLLSRLEDWGRHVGILAVRVRSNVTRERAHRFYLRNGYALRKTSHLFSKSLLPRDPA